MSGLDKANRQIIFLLEYECLSQQNSKYVSRGKYMLCGLIVEIFQKL